MEKNLSTEERIENGQVHARFIIEILGAPKEHVEKTLRDYIQSLKQDANILVVQESYSEAKPQDKFFSLFVELELWLKSIAKVVEFCFDALPSSVEIIDPPALSLRSADFSGLLNDLQARIHDYDFKLKDCNAKNHLLAKNSSAIMKNFIFLSLKEKTKTLEEIARDMGIDAGQLKPFIELMLEKKELALMGNRYESLV